MLLAATVVVRSASCDRLPLFQALQLGQGVFGVFFAQGRETGRLMLALVAYAWTGQGRAWPCERFRGSRCPLRRRVHLDQRSRSRDYRQCTSFRYAGSLLPAMIISWEHLQKTDNIWGGQVRLHV